MTTSQKHQCEARKPDGARCESFALTGGRFCYSHEPSIEAERIAVRRRGGQNHGSIPRLRKYLPPEARELYTTLEKAFEEIHNGTLDPKVGHALANMAKAMVATLSVSKTEYELLRRSKQIEQLEARINNDDRANAQIDADRIDRTLTICEPHRRVHVLHDDLTKGDER